MGEREVVLRPGGLYLLPPGLAHACRSEGLTGYLFHFGADVLSERQAERWEDRFWVTDTPAEDRGVLNELAALMLRRYGASRSTAGGEGELLRQLLAGMLTLVEGYGALLAGKTIGRGEDDRLVRGFLRLATVYYGQRMSVDWYAGQLGVSRKHLGSRVRAQTNKTIAQHLNERIMAEARLRLTHETLTIQEIAHDLGFRDTNYFWRFFRRHQGQSPGAFRKSQKTA